MKRCKIDWQFHFASYNPQIHGTAKAYCQSHGLNYNSWRVTKSRMKKEALARDAARMPEAAATQTVSEAGAPESASDGSALAPEQPAVQKAIKEAAKACSAETAPVSMGISGRPLKNGALSEADLLFLIMGEIQEDLPGIFVSGRSPGKKGPRKRKGPIGAETAWMGLGDFFDLNRSDSGFVEVLADV